VSDTIMILIGMSIGLMVGAYLVVRYSDYIECAFERFEAFAKRGR